MRQPGVLALLLACTLVTAADDERPSIADATRGMTQHEGLLPVWIDEASGKILLELPAPGPDDVTAELLYSEGLRTGLGSNPVGLDRGRLGATRWIVLRRIGPRVLLEQLNPAYRAISDDAAERRAARESFATSVLWGQEIAALDDDGRSLVDFTSFLVSDIHGVADQLEQSGQGSFSLDSARSSVNPSASLVFPDNIELEATLTFAGRTPGPHVRETAPDPQAVTLVLHHSLIRLPDDGYRPRPFHPHSGAFGIGFHDYAVPLDRPIRKDWISRHRLEKSDPQAARSTVKQPIVFYVDRGAPEPVRSALLDGAGWWAAAFEAAGFIDGYRVELLPEDAHPLDVRHNVIEWVHRSTRGWSFGGGVIDPRTGEILKGHVRLGSLRVRQDRLLFEGLAGTAATGTGAPDDPVQLALARIRQLAAHEVGHALGLSHNFAASSYADRASVMDYPAPLVTLGDGELDFSRAYGVGVGAWDKHAVRYAYSSWPAPADESAELQALVRKAIEDGLHFLGDQDARPAGAADPRANLWDNGDDPVTELQRLLEIRGHALARFGEANLADGTPLAHLQEVLAPLYFHHRYQLEAAAKVVGGMEYAHAFRGDGRLPTSIVSAERQRRALEAILSLLDPAQLDLPETVLQLLAPRPEGEGRNREMFASATSPTFDGLGAAATSASMAIDALLQPQRMERMIDFHRRFGELPGLEELMTRLLDKAFGERPGEARHAEIADIVRSVVVERLIQLSQSQQLRATARSRVDRALRDAHERLAGERAMDAFLRRRIERHFERPATAAIESGTPPGPPPGSPIGAAPEFADCGFSPVLE